MVFVAYRSPTDASEVGVTWARVPSPVTVYNVVDAVASKRRVNSTGTRLYAMPGHPVSESVMPTAEAVTSAVAARPLSYAATVARDHYFAARLGPPLAEGTGKCLPPLCIDFVPPLRHLANLRDPLQVLPKPLWCWMLSGPSSATYGTACGMRYPARW